MLCTAFTGCGDKDNSSSSSTSESTSAISIDEPNFTSTEADRVSIDGTSFVVNGEKTFMTGVNAPWQNWNDFGGNFNFEYWDEMFAEMEANGINSTRVWITCNGDVGINIDDKGFVTGATDEHWEDLDMYFLLAEKHHIYVMATLISFDHFKDTNQNYQKWRSMVQNDDAIDSYVQNYVIPFVKRYDKCEYLWSIDLCNEPDWVIEKEECGQLSWDSMGHYFARTAAAIHENSDILVTVGFGMIKYNSDKYEGDYGSDKFLKSCYDSDKAYLDFNSTHYYKWQVTSFGCPFVETPEEFGMDTSKPMVLGECETAGFTTTKYDLSLADCYKFIYDNGWAGMIPWTTDGTEPYGEFETNVVPAAKEFSQSIK